MIDPLAVCFSDNAWRNLADLLQPGGADSAEACTLDRGGFLGLVAKKRGLDGLRGAEVQKCRQHQERQAADNRVERQRHQGGKRQGEGSARDHQANQGRRQDQTREHVHFPPHTKNTVSVVVVHGKIKAAFGRIYVAISRNTGAAPGGFRAVCRLTLACGTFKVDQPGGDFRMRLGRDRANPLKRNEFRRFASAGGGDLNTPAAVDGPGSRATAALWRKHSLPDVPCTPELTDVCLSFVMPEQQAARAAACEDVR